MIRLPDTPIIGESDCPDPADYEHFHPFIRGVFSQWHPAPFVIDGTEYSCAEQYMMAAKASLFGDSDIAARIMATNDPALKKRLGAQVSGFDDEVWREWRIHIVYVANRAKFSQNGGALRQLRNTAPAMLVEANPRDWNWGNGLHFDDAANQNPDEWRGTNYLGRILTLVRDEFGTH